MINFIITMGPSTTRPNDGVNINGAKIVGESTDGVVRSRFLRKL